MANMKLLFAIVFLAACASAIQAACPANLVTATTTITTNDVILIKSPLLSYNDSATVCQCFGEGWAVANSSVFFDFYHPSKVNQSSKASDDVRAFLTANLPIPISVWFGVEPGYNSCPVYEIVDPNAISRTSDACNVQKPAFCARSKLVYNPVGSPCDNNLQVCARGTYCNAPPGTGSGKCTVDNICFPNNPCAAGLATGYSSNKLDGFCTVTPGAPGDYTCECGAIQRPTNGPGPQTCVECPSANPCALIQCPAGSGCAYECGDYRGLRCETPDGTIVPPVTGGGSSNPYVVPPPPPPTGSQGVCGSGDATYFPNRCWFNNDPQGRYVCCDKDGCDGFNGPDYLIPRCKVNGFVPPGYGKGATPPPPPPPTPGPATPSGDQGVCGTGSQRDFPTRCYFNNDPQGRYVCCDNQGCDGFNPQTTLPNCKRFGFTPDGFGVGFPPPGSQGVCGSGSASDFPTRCWFNDDGPLGRYVCCDKDGCDGFAPPDNKFPRCKTNGYAPPGFGANV